MALTRQAPFNRNQFRLSPTNSKAKPLVMAAGAAVEQPDTVAGAGTVTAAPVVTSALNGIGRGPRSRFTQWQSVFSNQVILPTSMTGAGTIADAPDTIAGAGFIPAPLVSALNPSNLGPALSAPFGLNQFQSFGYSTTVQPLLATVGTGPMHDAPDTIAGSGGLANSGSGAMADAGDFVSGVGGPAAVGTGAMHDAPDTVAGSGASPVSGSGAMQDAPDTVQSYAANLPVAPTGLVASAAVEGAILLFAAPASNGGSALSAYVATANPGGATAMISATTTPAVGLSARIYFPQLTAGVAYTFTVHAVNANGIGPESAPSSAVTPLPYADYYVTDGGTVTGFNPAWSNYNGGGTFTPGVAAGTVLSSNRTGTLAPANPVTSADGVYEADIQSPYGYMLFYKQHDSPANSGNGRFPVAPYDHIQISLYPTVAGQDLSIGFYKSAWYNGVSTAMGSDTTLTDAAQNWPTNQFASFALNDMTAGIVQTGVSGNTATTVTFNTEGVVPQAGDYYELQQADISFGNSLTLATSGYGPSTMAVGAWNTYTIPLSALGIVNTEILKFILQDKTGLASNTFWVANLGFIRTSSSTDQAPGGSISGAGAMQDAPDTMAGDSGLNFADTNVGFDSTTVFFDGSQSSPASGAGAMQDAPDTIAGAGSDFINSGVGSILEAPDLVAGTAEGFVNTAPVYTDPVYVVTRTARRTFTVSRSVH
jgi:hypothetical protein